MTIPPFSDRIHFSVVFPSNPQPTLKVWNVLASYLEMQGALPKRFKVSQIAGHAKEIQALADLDLSPAEVSCLISDRNLTGFRVDTGHSARSVDFHLIESREITSTATLGCRIELKAKAPDDWGPLIESLMASWPAIGAWQWRHRYQVWQWIEEVRESYESRFGPLPPGYKISYEKVDGFQPQPDRLIIDISLNPGRPKELLPKVFFFPTAEMWLGPHFWQYAKCTKEDVLAADFFLEKRDTPHFLYLKSWHEPFTRPDGEQGLQQQRLWKLLFHEDCEWPPGFGGICDEPMYGPPELMPDYQPPEDIS
jgi:hypothetical protein